MGEFCGEVMIMWKGIDVSDNQGVINWVDSQERRFCSFAYVRTDRQDRLSICSQSGGMSEA